MSLRIPRLSRRIIASTAALSVVGGMAASLALPVSADATSTKVARTNLLRRSDFIDRGFAKATPGLVTPAYQETPECAVKTAARSAGFVNLERLAVGGAHTDANEVVVQFRSAGTASAYVKAYVGKIQGCEKAMKKKGLVWHTSSIEYPGVGAPQAASWNVTFNGGGTHWKRSIGVARKGRRVAVLELQSATNKPWKVIDTDGLLGDAVTRLKKT